MDTAVPTPLLFAAIVGAIVMLVMMMGKLRYALLVVLVMFWVAGTGSPGEFSRARAWVAVVQENRSTIFLLLGGLMFIPAMVHPSKTWARIPFQGALVFVMGFYAATLRIVHDGAPAGLESMVFAALTIGTMLLVLPAILDEWDDFYTMLRGLAWANAAWIGAVVVQVFANPSLLTLGKASRFLGLTGNPQHAAAFLAVLAVIVLWLILNDPDRTKRPLWLVLFGIDLILILWTGSRTGAGMFVVGAMMATYARIGKAVIYLPLLFLALMLAYQAAGWLGIDLANAERLTSTDDTRSGAWFILFAQAMEAPLIGHGIANAGESENSYLYAFAAFGLGMVVLLLLLMITSVMVCAKLFFLRRHLGRKQAPIVDVVLAINAMYFAGAVFEGYIMARVAAPLVLILVASALGSRLRTMAREELAWAAEHDVEPFAEDWYEEDEDEEEDVWDDEHEVEAHPA